MRILAVNWLDRENPQAGGAEVHFFEIFRRLVARGHHVRLVTSGWRDGATDAMVDGLSVRRVGGRHTFALRGRSAVRHELRSGRYDLVVEDINKVPLYLPTLTRLPVYVIIPHLFGTTVFSEASWPVASVVWLAEKPIPRVYRGQAFHAISDSTRDDLVRRGVRREAIRVIFPGVDAEWYTPSMDGRRVERPTFLYVGRLKRYKGLETALEAVALARRDVPDLQFLIAGSGDHRHRLEELAERLDLGRSVRFLGFIGEDEKRDLLRRSWAVVFPSPKEGWGITNVEAAACGTAAVASDSPGLRESVRHGQTGILVPHGNPEALSDALRRLSGDPSLVTRFGTAARQFGASLSWERAADQTEAHLLETASGANRGGKE